MKLFLRLLAPIFIFFWFCLSCQLENVPSRSSQDNNPIVSKGLKGILDTANMNGVILLYDEAKEVFFTSNLAEAHKRILPASTFKISNTIIGLETGLIENENTIFRWDGNPRVMHIWEEDLVLKEAFQRSCVPCYRELARNIGLDSMNAYLAKLNFGSMDVNAENIDLFWLTGASKINALEQIDFLRRLKEKQLPIKDNTTDIVEEIMTIESNENYTLKGKTGLAINGDKEQAWFVGWIEVEAKNVYFATRISNKKGPNSRAELVELRKHLTLQSLTALGFIVSH